MNKWVERAAIITGILAFIGVLIVSFITISESGNKESAKPITKLAKTTFTSQRFVAEPLLAEDKKIETTPVILEKKKPVVLKEETPEVKVDKKEITKKVQKPAEPPKAIIKQKWLTKEDLSDLLSAINNRKKYNSNNYNCVQIQSLKGANNKRATAQVEEYLSRKKFTITGRELISKSRKGINIKSKGKCLTVVIGSL